VAIRLLDEFKPEYVEGTAKAESPPIEWQFSNPSLPADTGTIGRRGNWKAGRGVADLQARDGHLTGRTTTEYPVLHAALETSPDHPGILKAIQIRMRISAGSKLAVGESSHFRLNLDSIIRQSSKGNRNYFLPPTPLVADDEWHTYTCIVDTDWWSPVSLSTVKHVMIRPTDVAGATFAIESIRLLSREEFYADHARLASWEGLNGIFHQTLVAQPAKTIRFPVTLPGRPQFFTSLGTIDAEPVGFQVKIHRAETPSAETILLSHRVDTPQEWKPQQIDLSEYAGQDVVLSLSAEASTQDALGYWGTPVIRNLGAMPPPATAAKGSSVEEAPQGVILIWADAVRYDHLKPYGYARDTAPAVSAMTAEGALFQDCLSQGTWTLPSTASLLTSRYVATHGLEFYRTKTLPLTATTMPEVFHDAGYATLMYSSVWFVGRHLNMHQGFDESHEYDSRAGHTGKTSRDYVARLLPWLDAHKDVPFFVFLHVGDPHEPYEPPAPYNRLWATADQEAEREKFNEKITQTITGPRAARRLEQQRFYPENITKVGIDPKHYITLEKNWYDGSIRSMDVELGKLFAHLKHLGLDEKTLVVFISDHGEEFFDHGDRDHGNSVYGEVAQVPLMLKWPGGIPAGTNVSETVETIDLMPTLLELSRLPMPDGMQGRSIVPLLDRSDGAAEARVAWKKKPAFSENVNDGAGNRAIVLDGWKLVHNLTPEDGPAEYELFDHRTDPLDKHNVASQHPEIVARLTQALHAWEQEARAVALIPDRAVERALTVEEQEHLRSLGYLD
jgi:arylsulfatase A-like enzyme